MWVQQKKERGLYMYPIINKNETAERLQLLMKYNRLKPTDIQDYLGLSCVQTVYRWLDGTNIPSIDNLYALSRLFDISVDNLLDGNKENIPPCSLKKTNLKFLRYYEYLANISS